MTNDNDISQVSGPNQIITKESLEKLSERKLKVCFKIQIITDGQNLLQKYYNQYKHIQGKMVAAIGIDMLKGNKK